MPSATLQHPDNEVQYGNKEIDLSAELGYPLRVVVNGLQHPQPLFWQSWGENEMVGESYFLQSPGLALKMLFSNAELNQHIPAQALAIADAATNIKFQILQAMLISDASMELALSNPLLFALLVNQAHQQKLDRATFAALVLEKRSKILDYLELPQSKSVLRLLSRTHFNNANSTDFNSVLSVLNDQQLLAKLRHVKQLSLNHLLFVQQFRGLFWPGVLEIISPESSNAFAIYVGRMVVDCCALGANLDSLRTITTEAALNALHDRLIETRNQARNLLTEQQRLESYGEFPAPPLAGNEKVVPLSSWEELMHEGKEMRHCISAHGHRINAGDFFAYKVLTEQRLTLAIAKRGETWRIDEIRGYANALPNEDALLHIHVWFKAAMEQQQLLKGKEKDNPQDD